MHHPISRTPSKRRQRVLGALACLAVAATACSSGDDTAAVKGAEVTRPAVSTTAAAPATSTTTTAPPVKVSSKPIAVHKVVPHRAEYRGGKLYLEGDVPSQKVIDDFVAKASAVIGAKNVINNYRIDPAASAPTDGRVIIDEPLLFPTASATLSPDYTDLVQLGYAVMKLNPKVVMRVNGYTDDVGDDNSNILLSIARADSVAAAISALGIDRKRFVIAGKGEGDPVASNDTPEGRSLNRRIEVELIGLLG